MAHDNVLGIEMKKRGRPQHEAAADRQRLRVLTKASFDEICSNDGTTLPKHEWQLSGSPTCGLNDRDEARSGRSRQSPLLNETSAQAPSDWAATNRRCPCSLHISPRAAGNRGHGRGGAVTEGRAVTSQI